MSKSKILFRIGSLQGGGAEKVLVTVLKNLDYSKYDIHLLLNNKRGVLLSELPKQVKLFWIVKGDEFYSYKNTLHKLFVKVKRRLIHDFYRAFPPFLYGKIIDNNYDVEVAFIQDIMQDVAKSPIRKSKKIGWVHTDLVSSKNISEKTKNKVKLAMKYFNTVVCVSNQVKKDTLSFNSEINPDCLRVIYNPLERKEIIEKSKSNILLFSNKVVNIVSIGRLSSDKSFDRLIRVAKKMLEEGIFNFKFHIVGEGILRSQLEEQILNLGVENNFTLHGYKENPYQYLNQADFFVLSSKYEGFSLVVAEALILQKPIISTKVSGPVELLKNGELGVLVDNNEEALYIAIKEFVQNPDAMNKYKEILVNNKLDFDLSDTIDKIENLFQK